MLVNSHEPAEVSNTPAPAQTRVEQAIIATLEETLPEAAQKVESACRNILQNFMAIADNARKQTKLIQDMMDHFNTVQGSGNVMSLDKFVSYINSTTILAVEKNLLFSHYGYTGSKNMTSMIDKVNAVVAVLEAGARKGSDNGSLAHAAGDLRSVIHELNIIRDKMSEVSLTKSERDLCSADLETLNFIALAAPERNRIFNDIAEGAMTCTQNINEACNKTIVQMQFQDRNTQIAENLRDMLASYKQLFVNASEETCEAEGFEKIYDTIRLEDIRKTFLHMMHKKNVKMSRGPVNTLPAQDDIELF